MAHRLASTLSFEAMIEYIVAVGGALAAYQALADLAEAWDARIPEYQRYRDERDVVTYAWLRAVAFNRARDFEWDGKILELSSESYGAAGKKASADPYAPLFGTIKATKARKLGAAKAVKFGSQLVAKLKVMDHPELNGLIPGLEAANEALRAAGERRDAAFEQVLLQNVMRVRRLTALQAAVADLEFEILSRFRGNDALVRVVLAGADLEDLDDVPDAPVAPPREGDGPADV